MKQVIDPEGQRLPLKLMRLTNGEFVPVRSRGEPRGQPSSPRGVGVNAKRLGMSRRDFLVSACGAATTLLAFNMANAAVRKLGGILRHRSEAALESQLAQARVAAR